MISKILDRDMDSFLSKGALVEASAKAEDSYTPRVGSSFFLLVVHRAQNFPKGASGAA